MAINKTQTTYFSSGEIKFSAIRDTFGDLAGTNVSASDYLRNAGNDVDWSDDPDISPRVPNATENADVATSSNWKTSQLRDSIIEYNITQSGNNEELEFADTDTSEWNSNLSKNVTKQMNVTGTIYANQVNKYALKFDDGDYNNLTISVPNGGAIYGEGGSAGGGNGGGALYIRNISSYDHVSITLGSNGRIWAGGGGGSNGNGGNSGNTISCFSNTTFNTNASGDRNLAQANPLGACQAAAGGGVNQVNYYSANPNDVRSRCRGGSFRRGQGWNSGNLTGYQCSPSWTVYCQGIIPNNVAGGTGGSGGNGGVGQGFSNQGGPGSGNSGNSGNTNSCATTGATSVGNAGNSGITGGTWGVTPSPGGSAGYAIVKKSASVNQGSSSNTIKGGIINV
jgi:hypothetical protein